MLHHIFLDNKYYYTVIVLLCCILLQAQKPKPASIKYSPLAVYSAEWNKPVYTKCNTADKTTYMSATEKEVIYILNLVRSYPKLFATTVLNKYTENKGNESKQEDKDEDESVQDTTVVEQPGVRR